MHALQGSVASSDRLEDSGLTLIRADDSRQPLWSTKHESTAKEEELNLGCLGACSVEVVDIDPASWWTPLLFLLN